jgi:retron-type reverse transcriptase
LENTRIHNRWISNEPGRADSKITIGTLVHNVIKLGQFLTAIKVAKEFIPDLNIDIKLQRHLNNWTELIKKTKNRNIERTIDQLREITEKQPIIKITSNCKYPDQLIYTSINQPEHVNREEIFSKDKWDRIFDLIGTNSMFESIAYKIHAIDSLVNNSGTKTPGIDGEGFYTELNIKGKKTREINESEKDYHKRIVQAIKDIHPCHLINKLSQKNNALKIKRIGSITTSREWLRQSLQSTKIGGNLTKLSKTELNLIDRNPIDYITKYNAKVQELNNKLKYKLLNEMKYSKLLKYKSDEILRILIPKDNRKISIPTLKDRVIQELMLTIMEPYMEVLGDSGSFGFRPGRNTNQAITRLQSLLVYNNNKNTEYKKNMKDALAPSKYRYKNLITEPERNRIVKKLVTISGKGKAWRTLIEEKNTNSRSRINYRKKYVIDAEIIGCFDNINHQWLIHHIPIPEKYKHLLIQMLKTRIVELEDKNTRYSKYLSSLKKFHKYVWLTYPKKYMVIKPPLTETYNRVIITEPNDNNTGIPQGGIISPLLMNWTLDGLSHAARTGAITKDGINKVLENMKSKTNILAQSKLVRYADNFVFVTCNKEAAKNALRSINQFMITRGLNLNDEKTKVLDWKMGEKLNFLGWTFHLIVPNRVNWLTDVPKNISSNLKDRAGLYVYPSSKSTKQLRETIKEITSYYTLTPSELITQLNYVITGWSNYFLPSPKQGRLRQSLDWFITKRIKKWIKKKYTTNFASMFRLLCMSDTRPGEKYNTLTVKNESVKRKPLTVKKLRDIMINDPFFYYTPRLDLMNNSLYLTSEPYMKRAIRLNAARNEPRAKLLVSQKMICPICKGNLIDQNNLAAFITENEMVAYPLNIGLNKVTQEITKIPNINWNKQNSWFSQLELDHILPFAFKIDGEPKSSTEMEKLVGELTKIREDLENRRLVHKHCHTIKTKIDHQTILWIYRRNLKELKKYIQRNKCEELSKFEMSIIVIKKLLDNKESWISELGYIKTIYSEKEWNNVKNKLSKMSHIIDIIWEIQKTTLESKILDYIGA